MSDQRHETFQELLESNDIGACGKIIIALAEITFVDLRWLYIGFWRANFLL